MSTINDARQTAGVKPTKERWVLVLILLLTLLIAYWDRVNVSILLADNAFLTEMGIKGDPVRMGLIMTLFLIAYGLANILLSPLGDWMGPRKAMSLSILLWTVSVAIGGFAAVFTTLLVSRVILGIGEGMHWPMQSSFVKNWFPPGERGKANAVWLIGLMGGPALAMPFFSWVLAAWGWRGTFFSLVILGMIPLLIIWFYVTDHPRQHKRVNKLELDWIESGLKAEAEQQKGIATETLAQRIKSFATDYRFWLLTVNYFCVASIWWGTMAWLPNYLKEARGFSWNAMGALAALPYVLGGVSLLVFGHLADKWGRRAPFICFGHIGAALGIYFGAHAPDNLTAALMISAGIASIALALPQSWTILQQIVPSKAVGAATGSMNGLANAGSAFAPVLIGYFISVTGGYVGGLMFLVGVAVLGAFCMAILSLKKY
ncbi:MFS transporter [Sporomusa termitida]|uniref:Putative sulfoacetate transporter SauU n=1 Tax=Sporomusa termitida TaxID=2377 RepID=A0A517DYI9_9FIRM|nr:MFS transporter [Sporomusa termitida]QDR82427.1 putative sulfoacetate transporter SauU [Sporomusa termitida]